MTTGTDHCVIGVFLQNIEYKMLLGVCLQIAGQFPGLMRLLLLLLHPDDRHGQVQVHPPTQAEADIHKNGCLVFSAEPLNLWADVLPPVHHDRAGGVH